MSELCSCEDPRPLVAGATCRRCHKPTSSGEHVDLSNLGPDTYVSFAQVGRCHVCGNEEDLRLGACFDCADLCDGKPIPGGHELWEIAKPENRWRVQDM
jgi:hypothetical protein